MKFDTTGLEGYLTDEAIESETGIWKEFPGGRRFRILRAGGSNQRFVRAFQTALKPHRRARDRGTMDPDVADQILRETYARYVVIDWKGIRDSEGRDVPYSPAAAVEFFRAVPELFSEVVTIATDMATFSYESIEEAKEALGES